MQTTFAAVLTGDIVKSRAIAAEDYEQLLYTLQRTLQMLLAKGEGKFDIYRGDAFQAIFADPAAAIQAALVLRLALRTANPAFDARQCIGIGSIAVLRSDVRSSMGEAFVLSGSGLDNMKGTYLAVHSHHAAQQERLELVTRLMDAHLSHLSPAQSEVLLHYLLAEDKSHQAVALAAGKNRSNVTRLLNASRYHLVVEYLTYCQRYATEGQTA
jgi:hypothetical protein